eukprot:3940469-Rhodomonas_salina.2
MAKSVRGRSAIRLVLMYDMLHQATSSSRRKPLTAKRPLVAMPLRLCYAMSGNELGCTIIYPPTRICGNGVDYGPTPVCFAARVLCSDCMCGTDLGYAAMR